MAKDWIIISQYGQSASQAKTKSVFFLPTVSPFRAYHCLFIILFFNLMLPQYNKKREIGNAMGTDWAAFVRSCVDKSRPNISQILWPFWKHHFLTKNCSQFRFRRLLGNFRLFSVATTGHTGGWAEASFRNSKWPPEHLAFKLADFSLWVIVKY